MPWLGLALITRYLTLPLDTVLVNSTLQKYNIPLCRKYNIPLGRKYNICFQPIPRTGHVLVTTFHGITKYYQWTVWGQIRFQTKYLKIVYENVNVIFLFFLLFNQVTLDAIQTPFHFFSFFSFYSILNHFTNSKYKDTF